MLQDAFKEHADAEVQTEEVCRGSDLDHSDRDSSEDGSKGAGTWERVLVEAGTQTDR